MSILDRSIEGSPSTIHSAVQRPIPAAPVTPWAQKPAATKNPRTSVSPRMKSSSGVNASGPLMNRLISVVCSGGISRNAPSAIDSNRSHFSGRSRWLKSRGIGSLTCHGSGFRS